MVIRSVPSRLCVGITTENVREGFKDCREGVNDCRWISLSISKSNERKEPGETCLGLTNSPAQRWINVRSKAKRNNPIGAGGNARWVSSFTPLAVRTELFCLLCRVSLRVLDNNLRNLYYLPIVFRWIDLQWTLQRAVVNLMISNLLGAHSGTVATIPPFPYCYL